MGPSGDLDLRHGQTKDEPPYRPLDVWWQQANRGFTTRLLPRLILDGEARPVWVQQLGIANPSHANSRERLLAALERLRGLDPPNMKTEGRQDLVELYRALVHALLDHQDPPAIPLLVRPVDWNGRGEPVRWARPDEAVWYEPDRADHVALRRFKGVLHWVVRKRPGKLPESLGLRHFRVEHSEVGHRGQHGPADEKLESALHDQLTEALPDLLAASIASQSQPGFNIDEAIQRFTTMTVRHFDDVWIEWTFDGKVARQGEHEPGYVFLRTLDDGRVELCFDGTQLPLARCADPLSELLAGNRAFGSLYRDALHAWASNCTDGGAALRRFRSEQQDLGDLERMHARVQASIMSVAERTGWLEQLGRILSRFGEVKEQLEVGMVIRPQTFGTIAMRVHENDVQRAVAGLQRVQPRVDFYHPHGIELDKVERLPLLAEMAERNRGAWTEAKLDKWKAELDKPRDGEDEERRHLGFDATATLRRRLGLPAAPVTRAKKDAESFAAGQSLSTLFQ